MPIPALILRQAGGLRSRAPPPRGNTPGNGTDTGALPASNPGGLTDKQVIGVIIGSICGATLLAALCVALACTRCFKRAKKKEDPREGEEQQQEGPSQVRRSRTGAAARPSVSAVCVVRW
jgi:hypothetical protein